MRNWLLTATGLLCAILVLGHLYAGFSGASRGAQENLMGETFLSTGED